MRPVFQLVRGPGLLMHQQNLDCTELGPLRGSSRHEGQLDGNDRRPERLVGRNDVARMAAGSSDVASSPKAESTPMRMSWIGTSRPAA